MGILLWICVLNIGATGLKTDIEISVIWVKGVEDVAYIILGWLSSQL
jgi:hypothetical protein